ncbi:MAG TPA: hypothetical protein VFD82_18165 [Planctomycetota bacterium]|nr:hypothetical protein [Planctomycetota bacterium]
MPPRSLFADVAIAALLAVAVAGLHAATSFGRVWSGDGRLLAEWTVRLDVSERYHNALYVPAAWLCDALLPRGLLAAADDPLALAKSLSSASAGVGAAFSYLCCRLLGSARWAGVAGTALFCVSPGLWFFGSAIEVHAQHFAVVAFCALATLVLPWRRPVVATALATAVFLLPCLSHQTAPLLGPGWILLVQCARRRVGPPFSVKALLAVGAALLAAVVCGHMLVQWRRGLGFAMNLFGAAAEVGVWHQGFRPSLVWTEVLWPLFLCVPVALIACCWRAIDPWLRACGALTLASLIAGVLWWGIMENGGYLLGAGFVLAALVASLWSVLPRRAAVATAVLAVGAQFLAGWHYVRDFDAGGFQVEDRVRQVRAHLGTRGVLLSCNDNAPNIAIWLPAVQEHTLIPTLIDEGPMEAWFATIYPVLLGCLDAGPLALDASYRFRPDFPDRLKNRLSLVEAALRRDCRVTEFDDPCWPLLVLEKR